ncbi:MAG: hypothetical protein ABMA64_22830 [Myxococcota bacterium]
MLRALTRSVLAFSVASAVACTDGDEATGETGKTDPEPVPITDSFVQTLTSPIDILWAIDPEWTEAMDTIDRDLEDAVFEILLLADPSWKVGVIDTTATGSKFGIIGTQLTAWPAKDPFAIPSTGGSSKVREAIHMALELRKDQGQNGDFIRSDAHLYVIVMTARVDESEAPSGTTTTGIPSSAISQQDFDAWFAGFQPSDSTRLSVITESSAKSYWNGHLKDGKLFEAGSFRSVMKSAMLDAIGQDTVFELTRQPTEPPPIVSVTYRSKVTDYVLGTDYQYDPIENTIAFVDVVPPPEATIEVTYLPLDGEPPVAADTTTSGD